MFSANLKTSSNTRILYLGLELPASFKVKNAVHFPIIQIMSYSFKMSEIQDAFNHIQHYTHFIFTSKTAVHLFIAALAFFDFPVEILHNKNCIVVGKSTAKALEQYKISADIIACNETAEGVVEELIQIDCSEAHFFWPHSAHARPIITDFFKQNQIKYEECILYETHPINHPGKLPDLSQIDEIVFTSPSTVDAFIAIFGKIPLNMQITAIGPVTKAYLDTVCERIFINHGINAFSKYTH